MSPIRRIADLSTLLALPGVVEELELGSTFGVCALHGGGLERATEVVAREVAGRTGASYYGVLQPEGSRHHLSSTGFDPSASPRLADFLGRVETIVSIHGYGRDDDFFAVLLGGTNRPFANHLAGHLRGTLPDDFRVVDDLGIRGVPIAVRVGAQKRREQHVGCMIWQAKPAGDERKSRAGCWRRGVPPCHGTPVWSSRTLG